MISLLLRIEGGEQSKPLFFTKMFDRRYIFTWPGTYNRAPDDRASQVLRVHDISSKPISSNRQFV